MALLKCVMIALAVLAVTEATSFVAPKPYTYTYPSEVYPATGYYPASLSSYTYNPTEYQRTGYYNPTEFYQRTGYYNPYSYQRYYATGSSAPAAYETPVASSYQAYPYYPSVYPAGTSGVYPYGTSGVYPYRTSEVYPSRYTVPNYPAGYVAPVEPVATVSHTQVPAGGFGYSYTTYGQPATTNIDATKVKVGTKP